MELLHVFLESIIYLVVAIALFLPLKSKISNKVALGMIVLLGSHIVAYATICYFNGSTIVYWWRFIPFAHEIYSFYDQYIFIKAFSIVSTVTDLFFKAGLFKNTLNTLFVLAFEVLTLAMPFIVGKEKKHVQKDSSRKNINKPIVENPVDEIKKLKELLDMNVITQEEFDKKKKELLG